MTTECQEAKGSHQIKQGNNMVDVLVEKASLLEGRWQAAWLTCLEWQCLLEQLVKVEEEVEEEEEGEVEAATEETWPPVSSSKRGNYNENLLQIISLFEINLT